MATQARERDVVLVIAEEMANGVQNAVDCWMTEIDLAVTDSTLSTLARLNAVRELIQNYNSLTGQEDMD